MGLWGVQVGEEGSSPTCYILLFLPHLCPSCSCVWHTASSPSAPTHSWSASWWASSVTSLVSPQRPWCSGALGVGGTDHTTVSLIDGGWALNDFLLRSCCVALTEQSQDTHSVMSGGGNSSKGGTCQGQGRHSDKAQTHALIIHCHTHTPVYKDYMQMKCLSSRGRTIIKKPHKNKKMIYVRLKHIRQVIFHSLCIQTQH